MDFITYYHFKKRYMEKITFFHGESLPRGMPAPPGRAGGATCARFLNYLDVRVGWDGVEPAHTLK